MKAQSLRRTLWLASALLALGLAGGVAWAVVRVRPSLGEPSKDVARWVDKRLKEYRAEAIQPQVFYGVERDDLEHIIQERDVPKFKLKALPKLEGKKVGAFVGPVPPEPQPDAPVKPPETGPKGLAEVGSPRMVFYLPGGRTSFRWEFPDKKQDSFRVGEVIPEGGKFRVVDVVPIVEGDETRYRFVYETVEGKDGAEPRRDEHVFGISTAKPSGAARIVELDAQGNPIAPAPAPRAPGEAPTADPAATAAPVKVAGRVAREKLGANQQGFYFDDRASYDRFSRDSVEKILETVKTETALDDAGRPRGIKITAPGLGEEFDVKPGDVVISVDGKPVHSRNDVVEIVKKLPKDTATVAVVIERNGRPLTYQVDPRDPDVRAAAGRVRFK